MNPALNVVGFLNGNVPVQADFNQIASSVVSYVTLNQPYTLQTNPGQPTRPQFCGTEVALGEDTAGTVIPAGARLALLTFEASAIVTAGGGVLS
jgi:hypothetical protein